MFRFEKPKDKSDIVTLEAEDENQVLDDDLEDLYKSVEKARRTALKKQEEKSGPEAQGNEIVITEIEEFAWRHKLPKGLFSEANKPDSEDVFMEQDAENSVGGWSEAADEKDEIVPDETIREVPIGKGLGRALKLLRDRGLLEETIEWGGRRMDKKKRKLVDEGIRIERRDEFGRTMTPKEAFRKLSHKFHGKGPGKKKQEKRMKQYQEGLKLKQIKNSDTPSLSAERMREAQAQLKTPYLVLSGYVEPGNIEFDLTKEELVPKNPTQEL